MEPEDGDLAGLLARTRGEGWQTRRDAVVALAPHAFTPGVRDRLIELFGDDDLAVVAAAAEALVVHGADQGLDAVIGLLEDGPDDAGYAVLGALVEVVHHDPRSARAITGRVGARPPRRAVSPELLAELFQTPPSS